jgi:hypothetical protein
VVESLKRHRVQQLEHRLAVNEVYEDRGYVFANETGGYLHTNTLYRRFHELRHTSATLLLAEGVHGKIVQERLGHANIAMTLDLYSHVTSDMHRQAADALEAEIQGAAQRSAWVQGEINILLAQGRRIAQRMDVVNEQLLTYMSMRLKAARMGSIVRSNDCCGFVVFRLVFHTSNRDGKRAILRPRKKWFR